MKGIDFRSTRTLCRDITDSACAAAIRQREAGRRAAEERVCEGGGPGLPYYQPTDPLLEDWEWEQAVARCAIEAHRQGYRLFGIAPDISPDKAGALLVTAYPRRRHRSRSRWKDWLPLIELFEEAESSGQRAKSQVFAHYRRAVDGIRFT